MEHRSPELPHAILQQVITNSSSEQSQYYSAASPLPPGPPVVIGKPTGAGGNQDHLRNPGLQALVTDNDAKATAATYDEAIQKLT